MIVVGIDPGLSGAIAILENNKVLNIFDIREKNVELNSISDNEYLIKGKKLKDRIRKIPISRLASKNEIAEYIFYLIDKNTFISSETLSIAGGE